MNEIFKKWNWPTLVVITVIIIHIAIFISKFGIGYSSKISDWSDSSNFFNLIVLIIFSSLVYNYNQKRDSENDNFQKLLEKPTIGFDTVGSDKEIWCITNLGKGAALNIRVAYMQAADVEWQNELVVCYHLSSGQNRELAWLTEPRMIVALYNDILGNSFLSLVIKDASHIVQLDRNDSPIGGPPIIDGITFNSSQVSKIVNLPQRRLYTMSGTDSSTTSTQTTSPQG